MATPHTGKTLLTDAEKARLLRISPPAPATPADVLAFRKRHHLRVIDLARLLGIDPVTVTIWERTYVGSGKPKLNGRYATVIARALTDVERQLQEAP